MSDLLLWYKVTLWTHGVRVRESLPHWLTERWLLPACLPCLSTHFNTLSPTLSYSRATRMSVPRMPLYRRAELPQPECCASQQVCTMTEVTVALLPPKNYVILTHPPGLQCIAAVCYWSRQQVHFITSVLSTWLPWPQIQKSDPKHRHMRKLNNGSFQSSVAASLLRRQVSKMHYSCAGNELPHDRSAKKDLHQLTHSSDNMTVTFCTSPGESWPCFYNNPNKR